MVPKQPPWIVRIIKKTKQGYEVVHESKIPGHKLTDEAAKILVRSLFLSIAGATIKEIVDSSLVRHKPRSFLGSISRARWYVDLEKRMQGYHSGSSECIVSASQEIQTVAALLYQRARQDNAHAKA